MIEIIPAIDMIGGECVRLTQGDYARRTVYYKDPLEAALRYEACGARRLHLVDLDGAKASHPVNLHALERIRTRTSLEVQYGGGIKSAEALRAVFDSGASRAIRDGRIAIHGWQESSATDVDALIERFRTAGLRETICTDIARDGMLSGPSIPLYTRLQQKFPEIDIVVSGGIASWDDIEALDAQGLRRVVVGKAIYEGRIGFDLLERHFRKTQIPQ